MSDSTYASSASQAQSLLSIVRSLTKDSVFKVNDDWSDEEVALESANHAIALVNTFKEDLSLVPLDTVIDLYRQILNRGPAAYKPIMSLLHDLAEALGVLYLDAYPELNAGKPKDMDQDVVLSCFAAALGIRYLYKYQSDDLTEALKSRPIGIMFRSQNQVPENNIVNFGGQSTDEMRQLVETALKNLHDFWEATPLHTLDIIISLLRISLPHFVDTQSIRATAMDTLSDALGARFFVSLKIEDLDDAISNLQDTIKLVPATDYAKLSRLYHRFWVLLCARFDYYGDRSDMTRASGYLMKALTIQWQATTATSDQLSELDRANVLRERGSQSGNLAEINTAIALMREVIPKLLVGSQEHISALVNLAAAMSAKYLLTGERADLEEGIALSNQILEIAKPSDPNRPMAVVNFSQFMLRRFQQEGRPEDLAEAISLCRQVLESIPLGHPLRFNAFHNLAQGLFTRFRVGQGTQQSDIDEAISSSRQALNHAPKTDSDRAMILTTHAIALRSRFEHRGKAIDLAGAILYLRQAINLPNSHYGRIMSLAALGSTLLTRFQHSGRTLNLTQAISFDRQALELCPPPHPHRHTCLDNLATALLSQFAKDGKAVDLAEAMLLQRQALDLIPPPRSDRAVCLHNLAHIFLTHFEQHGHRKDLDEAVSLHREALELVPPLHVNRSGTVSNLANALLIRFDQMRQADDLEEAIILNRQALGLIPPTYTDRFKRYINLANSLKKKFERSDQITDLDEAISYERSALESIPAAHPNRSLCMNNLARSLALRFERTGVLGDITEAISLHRTALDIESRPLHHHPDRSFTVSNLASALVSKYKQGAQSDDIAEAILLHREALQLQPSPHPQRAGSLMNLGDALIHAHVHNMTLDDADYVAEAMESYRAATQCSPLSAVQRLIMSKMWISQANAVQHISEIDAYDTALQTLPLVAALSLDIESRRDALSNRSDGLARDASRRAIQLGNYEKAVEFLEAGRSIFWSQVLSLRSPLENLRDVAPQLANTICNLSAILEHGFHRSVSVDIMDNRRRLALDRETERLNRLNDDWSNAIEEVRRIDGFSDFLRPRRLSSLQAAATTHPIIFLVENDGSSECLIIQSTTVRHISLPGLKTSRLRRLAQSLEIAVSYLPNSRSINDGAEDWINEISGEERGIRVAKTSDSVTSDDIFIYVLKILWTEVVRPVIDLLELEKSDELPTVQWCPTGWFTFLPIHAAGCYDKSLPLECASDYFISSYTPTVGVLLTPDPPFSVEPFRMMAVIQSSELSSTAKELENIRRYVSDNSLIELGVPGAPAVVEEVASHISEASIVHFACHAFQDQYKPLESGLKLQDGSLKVSRIMKEKILNGSLAFLCACETAMGDANLPDESMSLGASLLFSGFRHVVATMWSMHDEDGPVVADAFYGEIFRNPDGDYVPVPDTSKSARALHIAIQKLRSDYVPFRRWVPFIHMGR